MALSRMSKNTASDLRPPKSSSRVVCEDVRFAEVDFVRPVIPRVVIEFSEGLCLLLEDSSATELAAEFITAFRRHEAAANTNKKEVQS